MKKQTKMILAGAGSAVGLILILVIAIKFVQHKNTESIAASLQNKTQQIIQDDSTGDTTKETLTTLVADDDALSSSVKNISQQVDNAISKQDAERQKLADSVNHKTKEIQQANQDFQENIASQINALKSIVQHEQAKSSQSGTAYTIGGAGINGNGNIVWVDDMSISLSKLDKIGPAKNVDDLESVLNPGSTVMSGNQKPKPKPFITLPVDTILTDAIALQPLVGRIPYSGNVVDPRSFEFMIQSKNLTSNGFPVPPDIKGILGSAVCQGDLLARANNCYVSSLTFVFQDGTISTTKADPSSRTGLGSVADQYGNVNIPGTYHGDILGVIGGTSIIAGAMAYGTGLSQAQMQTQTGAGSAAASTISTLIGSANTYAEGQAINGAASAVNTWWMQRVQSVHDYIYTSNWDPETHQMLRLNITLSQQINIDHDQNGRKVFYGQNNQNINANLD